LRFPQIPLNLIARVAHWREKAPSDAWYVGCIRRAFVTTSPAELSSAGAPAGFYSYALRCIGQNLESLELKSLDVKTQGDKFIIQGWSKSTPSTMDVVKQYAPEDIKKLDEEGRAKRKMPSMPSNLLSLPQVLRFCGSYVDRLRGRLTRISWQDQTDKIQSITIQFVPFEEARNARGDAQVTMIEELCIHVYKQRKKMTIGSDKLWHRPATPSHSDL
jgi:hypothetical protein